MFIEGSKTDAFTESVENVYPLSSTNEINEDEDDESDGDAGVQHFQHDTTETLEVIIMNGFQSLFYYTSVTKQRKYG